MRTKTKVTVHNIINRLTDEEIKMLYIKYRELAKQHYNDFVDVEKNEYTKLAKVYGEAYEISSSRNFVKTIRYGTNGRQRIESC